MPPTLEVAAQQLKGPTTLEAPQWEAWLDEMIAWRRDCRSTIHYNGSIYEHPALKWTQTSYMQPQMHLFDRFFYNTSSRSYTVDVWLDDLIERYGGIDSALLWPTYPNIGLDDRNQFEMITSVPGGIRALKKAVQRLHARGVKVLWPLKPWDKGTRRPQLGELGQMMALLKETNGDGINGDTFPWVPEEYFVESVSRNNKAAALEPELGGREYDGRLLNTWLNWHTMSWGYWDYPSGRPPVAKWKWFESRHMTHVCDRWQTDRVDNLQFAYLNGVGYETWENVWSTWNGFTPRDGEATRRVGRVLRLLGRSGSGYLTSKSWIPHAPNVLVQQQQQQQPSSSSASSSSSSSHSSHQIYASAFPHERAARALKGDAFYALINRGSQDVDHVQLALPVASSSTPVASSSTPSPSSMRFFELFSGQELSPLRESDGVVVLSFAIEARGYAGVLATSVAPSDDLLTHLTLAQKDGSKPLARFDATWRVLPQQMTPVPRTPLQPSWAPIGMVRVPAAPSFLYESNGLIIEPEETVVSMANAVDVQHPWEPTPRRAHSQRLRVRSFFMDKFPVTCADYAAFLRDHHYEPRDKARFLQNWRGDRQQQQHPWAWAIPEGHERKPVVYVSLDDARAYCAAQGKRLPRVWEWSLAARGTDGRLYPWGNEDDMEGWRYPKENPEGSWVYGIQQMVGPEAVDAHSPQGESPYGVADLVGNTWEYTDELIDAHTRSAILKGGSNYKPAEWGWTSQWYFPQAKRLDLHNKYLLMGDSYERAGTLGFRCVQDADGQGHQDDALPEVV